MVENLLKKAAGFHGHVCPGLALGVRVAGLALREFAGRAEDEELLAIVENDSCAVDAVQALTACTFGKGNLIFHDYGKQVYTFVKRPSGDALRVSVNWVAPEETEKEKTLWKRYMEGDRSGEVLRAVHQRKSKKVKLIMNAPEDELFKVKKFRMRPPCEARIYQSVICARCGEKTMETRTTMLRGRLLCRPCFGKETGCRR